MKQIVLFGAGKSATCLIDYLIANALAEQWHITIADKDKMLIEAKTQQAVCTTAISIDILNTDERNALIAQADIVISMMPPSLHSLIATDCVQLNKNLLTASYVDDAIKAMHPEIEKRGLLFLCEMGLDPGIDHMSAMQLIHEIQEKGGNITSFKSHCGGLVAPESDDNPWHYKISWNPRNVVLAGNAGAAYQENGNVLTLPYEQVFSDGGTVQVPGIGALAWYPNRDSLGYMPLYQLQNTSTFIRTTLRHPAFCKAWQLFINYRLTTPTDKPKASFASIAEWFNAASNSEAIDSETAALFAYLGLYSNEPIPAHCNSSADILQHLLEQHLALQPDDKDMIVMVHEIGYAIGDQTFETTATLIVKGENNSRTAMAKTVGLPLGIATKLILNGTMQLTGLHIPIINEIYEPVLKELEEHGISFI